MLPLSSAQRLLALQPDEGPRPRCSSLWRLRFAQRPYSTPDPDSLWSFCGEVLPPSVTPPILSLQQCVLLRSLRGQRPPSVVRYRIRDLTFLNGPKTCHGQEWTQQLLRCSVLLLEAGHV